MVLKKFLMLFHWSVKYYLGKQRALFIVFQIPYFTHFAKFLLYCNMEQ